LYKTLLKNYVFDFFKRPFKALCSDTFVGKQTNLKTKLMMQDRLKMIETMLETNPKDSFLHYAAALEHQKNGEIPTAIKIIQKIIKNDPEYLASYYQLGKMLEERNKVEDAVEVYKSGKSVARKQNDMKTLGELSEALMLLDVYED
jgi:tetratricopeptide (TPR) repeat protein